MKLLEPLYHQEIHFLHWLQGSPLCKGFEEFWLRCTKLGDPSWTFFVYFPLLFPLKQSLAIRFLLAGAIGEFGNGVLKWLLHGERPFWYVMEEGLNETWPLEQFRYTCETGPGSPSGHLMVTTSVFFVLFSSINSSLFRKGGYMCLACLLLVVSVSRLFIAAHFPHQVFLGLFAGLAVGYWSSRVEPRDWGRKQVFQLIQVLAFAGLATFFGLVQTGFDPNWSIPKAMEWCSRIEWIHLSTHPMSSLFRDIGALLGLAFIYPRVTTIFNQPQILPRLFRAVLQSIMNLAIVQLIQQIPLPVDPYIFYVSTMFLHIFLSIGVIHIFPTILGFYKFGNLDEEVKSKSA